MFSFHKFLSPIFPQIQYGDVIYHLDEDLLTLDVTEWRFQSLGAVPEGLDRQGRCAYAEVGGRPGIFNRYGYWFDLTTESW